MQATRKDRRIRGKNGRVLAPHTCVYRYRDWEGVERESRGRTFKLEGQELELFSVGTLCNVLRRHYKTLYKWEKDFGFPPALYRIADDKKCNRWYSRRQLLAIETIYKAFGQLQKKHRTDLGRFIACVRKVFYEVDQPLKERTET